MKKQIESACRKLKLKMRGVRTDKEGREIPDPRPVALPVGYKKPPTLQQQIQQMIRAEDFRRANERQGFETEAEADDFDVGDDFDPHSPYEYGFDPAHPEKSGDPKTEEKPQEKPEETEEPSKETADDKQE